MSGEEEYRSPKRLRAYMLADKNPQSPERAASGVKQDMFVAAII
jgi:hypothetical protein